MDDNAGKDRIFMPEYYGTWREDIYNCDKCCWKGTGNNCEQGEMFKDLFEICCPSCHEVLTVVNYPTIEESRSSWDKVSDADKPMIMAREKFIKNSESRCLESPNQLPDIPEDNLIFVWDKQDDDTLISFGNKVIWREPAFYEGYSRFEEVEIILKRKYDNRIKDLLPAERSQNYLLGDYLSAQDIIQSIRKCFELSDWQNLPTKVFGTQREIDWHNIVIEDPEAKRISPFDSRSAHDLSKL
jgi:hypothetical protein